MPSIKRCTAIVGGVPTFVDVVMTGSTGPAGPGVPVGGTANQILSKIDATNYNTQWVTPSAASVADGSITNVKLATMPANTVKMNNTAGVAAPTDVTVANLLTALGAQPLDADLTAIAALTATTNNVIQSVGSAWASRTPTQLTATLDTFTATLKGLVPPPTTATSTKYLRDDGTWVVPPDTAGISQATADTLYSPLRQVIIIDPNTTRTISLTDENKNIVFTSSTAVTVTIPLNSTTACPVGYRVDFVQSGTGKVSVQATGGVSLTATPSAGFRAQGSMGSLIKTAAPDTWFLTGDLA